MFKKNPKVLKKWLYIVLFIFVLQNSFSFYKDYQIHIINAPEHLKEANRDYIIAKLFANYNAFFIETFRMQTDNILLFPFREPMLYFYNKGLEKLPKDEPIRASWFNEFKLMMHNYSNKGKYGSLARDYGYEYARDFVDEVYFNIELLNKGKEKLNEYSSSGYKNELTTTLLQTFIHYVALYTSDYHLRIKGFSMSKENLIKVSTHLDLYERFKNIDAWSDEFILYYKTNYSKEYDAIINPNRGWYSDYRDYYLDNIKFSSYILFYEIKNNRFDCENSKKYLEKIASSKKILREFVYKYNVSSSNKELMERIIRYLDIKNISGEDFEKNENPLNLSIECKYN